MYRILAMLALLALLTTPASATDVVGDDTRDLYEISGAILLNASTPEAPAAAACATCHWRVIRICTSGSLEDRRACPDAPCASSVEIAELWRAEGAVAPPVGDPAWQYRGLLCLTEPPTALTDVTTSLHDTQLRELPPIRLTTQPSGTALTGLPTYFRTGQPATFLSVPANVLGSDVQIRAEPRWVWDFGHGAAFTTQDPGGPYPTGRIRHTYPRRGIYRVRVTCTWTAVFSTRGLTDIPIPGEITQTAWVDLRVREARRFLR